MGLGLGHVADDFVLRGTTMRPWANMSDAVLASTLSFVLVFLASSDFDNSTGRRVPGASVSDAGAGFCGFEAAA